jgi:hypothetical protein
MPPLCAAETALNSSTGAITDGAPEGGVYSGSSSCQWTVESPEKPYIYLGFSRFDTEPMYDTLTVEVGSRQWGAHSKLYLVLDSPCKTRGCVQGNPLRAFRVALRSRARTRCSRGKVDAA